MTSVRALFLSALLIMFAVTVQAGTAATAGPPSEARREEVRRKVETVRIWRMAEALKLNQDKSAQLSALLSSLDRKRRDSQRRQFATMGEIRKLLKVPAPDEAKLKPLLDNLEQNRSAMQDLRAAEFTGLKDILTVEQQARYLVFQQDFQREMRSMIAGARGNGPGRGGRGTGMSPPRQEEPSPTEEK